MKQGYMQESRNGIGRAALLAALAAALLCALMLLSAKPAWAQGDGQAIAAASFQAQATAVAKGQTFTKGGNTYKVTDLADGDDLGEVTLVKYGSTAKKAVVNTVTYKGEVYEVDAVGKNAFNNAKGHKVTSLTLGRNVDKVLAKAFYGCSKLKLIDMSKCDIIDIDRGANGYYLDDIDVGKQAFKKAGTASVKVKCGSKSAAYQKVFKQALVKKGMRSSVTVVK